MTIFAPLECPLLAAGMNISSFLSEHGVNAPCEHSR